jgi:hypothetical protein
MDEDVPTCPLCLEDLDATDRAMQPCKCSYVVCCWCLNHIRERLNGLCPACRTPYEEQNFTFKEVSTEAAVKEAKERANAKKERERREKLLELERERARAQAVSQQKHKTNLKHARFVQRNLVYVIGLSLTLAREEYLRRSDMFGRFGRILRVLVNRAHPYNADAPGGPSIAAYIQFARDIDASAAVRAMNNVVFDGREIRTAIACTKYCDTFVKSGLHCGNADCMYVHDASQPDDVLSREDVLARQLGPPPPSHLFLPFRRREVPPAVPAPAAAAAAASAAATGSAQTAAANAATAARQAALAAASYSSVPSMQGSHSLHAPMAGTGPPPHKRIATGVGGRVGMNSAAGSSFVALASAPSSSYPTAVSGSERYAPFQSNVPAASAGTGSATSTHFYQPSRVNLSPPISPTSAARRSRAAIEVLSASAGGTGTGGVSGVPRRPFVQQLPANTGWTIPSATPPQQQGSHTRNPSLLTNTPPDDGNERAQQLPVATALSVALAGSLPSASNGAPPGFEMKTSTPPLVGPPGFGAPRVATGDRTVAGLPSA